MSLKSGLAAQLGFSKEVTFNTYATPTRFIDFVSESIGASYERVESKAIRANARFMKSDDWNTGVTKIAGDVEFELWNKSFGSLFEGMFGGVSTSGPSGGLYTHTFTAGDLPSFTFQVGRPQVDGTVTPFTYTGCMVQAWEIGASVGDPVMVKASLVGAAETRGQSLATASYASGLELMTFAGGSVTVNHATPTTVKVHKISVKGDNGLNADRFFLGQTTTSQPLEASQRSVTGDFETDYGANSGVYDLFVNGTEANLVLTFAGTANPTHLLRLTTHIRVDGDTPSIGGTDIVALPVKFKAIATGADSTAVSVEYVTPDATP
jgi:hypothetical protein